MNETYSIYLSNITLSISCVTRKTEKSIMNFNWRYLALIVFTVLVTLTRAEECGHEELNKCSKSLQALNSASDLNFTPRREELDELCPELEAGLRCISSYTRRCMTLQKRNQFMKIYKGTKEVIRDICKEGEFQNEFLKHAACLRTVKPKHKKCEEKYQETMNSIKAPKTNSTDGARDDDVKNVCCSFREYLDCSEIVTRRTCGADTGTFIRGFLKKMSSTLEEDYCQEYYQAGDNQCPNLYSSSTVVFSSSNIVKSIVITLVTSLISLRLH